MRTCLYILFSLLVFTGMTGYAQEAPPTDDLGEVSDAFQEHFFEALKQKAIENYELALSSLQKARDAAGEDQQRAVVFFEMGKNLAALKRYDEAIDRYNQVLGMADGKMEVLEALYDVYYDQKNYEAALPLVERLSELDNDYKEDLANLYERTGNYQKALEVLDELDEMWGESEARNSLRQRIYRQTGDSEGAIGSLEKRIDQNPKNEQDYLNLIFLYSEQGDKKKAYETALELLRQQPASQKVHLALYKFYLDDAKIEEALGSMEIIFNSTQIDQQSKFRVLDDFMTFATQNPGHEEALEQVVAGFGGGGDAQVYQRLGMYFMAKGDKVQALSYYRTGLSKDPENFELIKNTLLLQIEFRQYQDAVALSERGLEVFPAQPLLYLLNGVANRSAGNTQEAIDSLLMGLDFLLDNPRMERDFYTELSLAYKAAGNAARSAEYQKKAARIELAN